MPSQPRARLIRVLLFSMILIAPLTWSIWRAPASGRLLPGSQNHAYSPTFQPRTSSSLAFVGGGNFKPLRPAQTVTWDGEGTTDNWSDAANWAGTGIVPQAGDDLVFPDGPSHVSSFNDLPTDTMFQSMSISGNGYILNGNPLRLNGNLTHINPVSTGTNIINLKITSAGGVVTSGLCSFCRLRLTANNEYTGTTTITGGVLTVNGNQPGTAVLLNSAIASLEGNGSVGALTMMAGSLRPGDIFAKPPVGGSLDVSGNFSVLGSSFYMPSFVADANNILMANLDVTGTVSLNNVRMFPFLVNDAVVPIGESFTLVNNDGTDPINGIFFNHPEGSTFAYEALRLRVTYRGGDGNDVTVRRISNVFADFDYDGRADISVYRPSVGTWYLLRSTGGYTAVPWGVQSDRIAPADYDGDGKTDIAVYRPSDGTWYVLQSFSNSIRYFQFGTAEDLPRPGDYNGDGFADFSVFRPSTGTWYRIDSGVLVSVPFGQSGDIPVIGDFVGDGKTDITVFRPSNGTWYIFNSLNGAVTATHLGQAGDIPTVGDYDGDGKSDMSVFRPADGYWYRLNSSNGAFQFFNWGLNGDIPAADDFDDDGKTDFAVFRPSTGSWFLSRSNSGFSATQFGTNQDVPVPSAYQ